MKHDWCPRCARRTEHMRWHLRAVRGDAAHRIRCNECAQERGVAASATG